MTKTPQYPQNLDNPFWQFSLSYWKNKSAQQALMELQDSHEQDINLLLFTVWFSLSKQQPLTLIIEKAIDLSKFWQDEVVSHLRNARRALNKDMALRSSVQKVELEAEQMEQAALFKLSESLPDAPNQTDDVMLLIENLKCCIQGLGQNHKNIPDSLILALVQTAFPALSLDNIKHHLTTWSL